MEPTVHAQDPTRPTRGLCGAGYDWPSGVRLDRSAGRTGVTCAACWNIVSDAIDAAQEYVLEKYHLEVSEVVEEKLRERGSALSGQRVQSHS